MREERSRRERAELDLLKLSDLKSNMKNLEDELSTWKSVIKELPGVSSVDDILSEFAALQKYVSFSHTLLVFLLFGYYLKTDILILCAVLIHIRFEYCSKVLHKDLVKYRLMFATYTTFAIGNNFFRALCLRAHKY